MTAMTEARCQICARPGATFCPDRVECNYRSRRRLGMPEWVCVRERAADLERMACVDRLAAAELESAPRSGYSVELAEHIASAAWRAFADEQKLRAGHRCECCGDLAPDLEVHHIDYSRFRRGLPERPEDVLVLCPRCHREWDELRRAKRRPHVLVSVVDRRRTVKWFEARRP